MSLNINVSNVWKEVQQVFINVAGTWKTCTDVYINVGGTWKSVLYAPGSASYTTAGSYSFTVPAGVYNLTSALLSGAGGGGGGSVFSGDSHGAANGGSGGYYSGQTIAVTPGETLTINVGAGGAGATSNNTGATGGTTSLLRGATVLYSATGGTGGGGTFGDNQPFQGGCFGGTPSGVAGSFNASWMANRNTPGQGYNGVGQNGTGYGNGGLGGNAGFGNVSTAGGTGAVTFSW